MKIARVSAIVLLTGLLGAGLTANGCKDSKLDARKLANALADEFTDGLEFENQVNVNGDTPPPTLASPGLGWVQAPRAIGPTSMGLADMADYDTWFEVRLEADSVIDPALVNRAVVHIEQANKTDSAHRYLEVTPAASDIVGSTMILRARMNYFNDVPGNAFHVRIALLSADGTQISNFYYWNIVTYPLNPTDETLVTMCICQATTETIDGPAGPWERLRSTNLRFVNKSACGKTMDGQYLLWEFYGTEDTGEGFPYNADPCMLWQSCYEGHDEGYLYPAGTRFFPGWIMPEDWDACSLEMVCD